MKTLGIVGGIGPESTIDYYRGIIALYRQRHAQRESPSIVISSIDPGAMKLIANNRLPELEQLLLTELHTLARAGADFALLAANTPHLVFDGLERQSPIPLLSIVRAACEEATSLGLKRPALLGTSFTMRGTYYRSVFSRCGIDLRVPDSREQANIHHRYVKELMEGTFSPETRDELLKIIARLRCSENVDGVILAGTELALLLRTAPHQGIPMLDTAQIHMRAAVSLLLL